jgi:membrane-associated PAP2 superfamily phosphatase
MGPARPLQALKLLALLLVPVLLWDFSGWDLTVARWFGGADGFSARNAFWAESLLHEGGRWLSGLLLLWVAVDAFWPKAPTQPGPSRVQRRWALLALILVILAVPALKRLSLTSCPWSLAEFGGVAQWVPHWRLGVPDGGPGGCFPSGHAVGSFLGFTVLLWLWAPWRSQRPLLWAGLCLGIGLGSLAASAGQWARGAHFVSHSLWSAWLCALLGWALLYAFSWRRAAEWVGAKKNPVCTRQDRVKTGAQGAGTREDDWGI